MIICKICAIKFHQHVLNNINEKNKRKVEVMAKSLLKYETIDSDQIADVMSGKKVRAPKPSKAAAKPPSNKKGPTIGPSDTISAQPSAKSK